MKPIRHGASTSQPSALNRFAISATIPPKDHPSPYWFDPTEGRILQEYQIIYLIKGEGVFHSAGSQPVTTQPGSIFLLFPGEWHNFYPKNKTGWETYWIGFKGQNMDALTNTHFFSKEQPVLDIGFNEQLIALFEQGIEIANHQKTAFQPLLAGITQLMLSIIFYNDRNNSFRDKDIIKKIGQARTIMRNTATHSTPPEKIAAIIRRLKPSNSTLSSPCPLNTENSSIIFKHPT